MENRVSTAIAALAGLQSGTPPETVRALQESVIRVQIARRFYNDAVRDTRILRTHRMPRMFRMAGRRPLPQFFDIDDRLNAGIAAKYLGHDRAGDHDGSTGVG